ARDQARWSDGQQQVHAVVPIVVSAATAQARFVGKDTMPVATRARHQRHGNAIEHFVGSVKVQGGNHLLGKQGSKTGEDAMEVASAAIELALREQMREVGAPV